MNIHSHIVPVAKPSTRSGELKREAILEAALELFVERGFHGTSVPSVADKAGVGAGTIYRYFANKEALVNEMFRRHKGALTAHVLDDFPFGIPAREQHRTFWSRMAEFARTQQRAFAFLELHSHRDYLDAESLEVERSIVDFGVRFFREAQRRGEVKNVEPLVLIGLVFGGFVGLIRMAWEAKLELTDRTLEQAEQCCWEAIRA